ncbi:hypothetical protein JRO89_XS06G0264500 [Xanthoceras sorbifolium]|uniref:Uncharacterized protein n=1 Tax=Xanthoceras sorbifolium TaxID=99658 RepID=A0ABQ8HZH4_9ROSI|nr:hypothetical protein JRO89_XS06G0264500 [Xanthoceras sorbifolium]
MEFFLKQHKLHYVITTGWPEIPPMTSASKDEVAAATTSQQKWDKDDGLCHDKPILDQVKELQGYVDSIIATGMTIDENFHVNAVISKLPPS